MASLPKRRPQEVQQNGALLSRAADSQGLLGACMGMSALFVLTQRLLAKGAHVSCVAIKEKKKKKKRLKKSRWIHEHSPDLEGGSERSAVPGLCTKIRAGLQHQTRQKGFARPLSEPELPTSSVPPHREQLTLSRPEAASASGRASRSRGARGDGAGFLILAQRKLARLAVAAKSKAARLRGQPRRLSSLAARSLSVQHNLLLLVLWGGWGLFSSPQLQSVPTDPQRP